MSDLCQTQMCAHCFRAPLAMLRFPVGGEPHVAAEFWIPASCDACKWARGGGGWCWGSIPTPTKPVRHQVCLPTALVNMVESVFALGRCSLSRGGIVPQVEQQVVHLAKGYTKEPEYAFALRRCVLWLFVMEQNPKAPADPRAWAEAARTAPSTCVPIMAKKPVCTRRWAPVELPAKGVVATKQPPPVATPSNEGSGRGKGPPGVPLPDPALSHRPSGCEVVGQGDRTSGEQRAEPTGTTTEVVADVGAGVLTILEEDDRVADAEVRGPRMPAMGAVCDGPGKAHGICSAHAEIRAFEDLRTNGRGGWECYSFRPCPGYRTVMEAARRPGDVYRWDDAVHIQFPDLRGSPPPATWTETRTSEDAAEPHFVADCAVDAEAQLSMDIDKFQMMSVTVLPPPDMQGDTPLDGGEKTMVRRMPHLGPRPFAFSNNGDNLSSANHLRCNGQAGDCREESVRELITQAAKAFAKIIVPSNKDKIMLPARVFDALPHKYTCKERQRYENDMWNLTKFTKDIQGSIKTESSAKPKPRPINAHGIERLAVNCPLLGAYESILKQRLACFTIKGKPKQDVMRSLSAAAERLAQAGKVFGCGFDQTAFEFGGNPSFKGAEDTVLRAVADLLGAEEFMEVPQDLLDYALNERLIQKDWIGQFKDKRGMKYKHVVQMYMTMRESGDRGTSSLNWLDNILWVCVSLCRPDQYEAFFKAMLVAAGNGGVMEFPAFDLGMVRVVFNAEGDDIMLWSDRAQDRDRMTAMAHAVGWCAKPEPVAETGNGFYTYVGFHVHTVDGVPQRVSGDYVMIPELRRFLTTKSWGASNLPLDMRSVYEAINMEMAAKAFENLPSMAAYCRALAAGWRRRSTRTSFPKYLKYMLREIEMRTGVVLSEEQAANLAQLGAPHGHASEEVADVALAMSSAATGGKWGELTTDDVIGLTGMVEFDPLSSADSLKQYVPRVWWA